MKSDKGPFFPPKKIAQNRTASCGAPQAYGAWNKKEDFVPPMNPKSPDEVKTQALT